MFETAAKPAYRRISADTAKRVIDDRSFGVTVVDVRTVEEYREARIPGAKLIPVDELEIRARRELPEKGAPILVYCMSGGRSHAAALRLLDLGYTEVYDFGSIYNWVWERESGPENPNGASPA